MTNLSSFYKIIIAFTFTVLNPGLGYGQFACPADITVCSNASPIVLSGGLPEGGTYTGTGVTNGIFYPTVTREGTNIITYSVGENNSVQTCTFRIQVNPTPQINCILSTLSMCIGSGPTPIFGCYPVGGDLKAVGPGIVNNDNVIHPEIAGPGSHQYEYTATNSFGCSYKVENYIYIYDILAPGLKCPEDKVVPTTSTPPFVITGGTMVAGTSTYSGTGVNSSTGVFNPGVAGSGVHIIEMYGVYRFEERCYASCTFKINVGKLPVSLKTFMVKSLENSTQIAWETTQETNFDHFEVERSANPKKSFTKIMDVKGNVDSKSYSITDTPAQKNTPFYYRLKMVDQDGTFAYSKIVWALGEENSELIVYPNPASREVSIQSADLLTELALFNSSGTQLFSNKFNKVKTKKITLPQLKSGQYLLKTKTASGKSLFSKLLIE